MTKYKATAELDGKFWLVTVEGVGMTQARHLRELDTMARDLVAVMTGAEPDSLDIEYDIRLPESVQHHLDRARELRGEYEQALERSARELRLAAHDLRRRRLPLRDIGEAMGISHQRVHQLLSAHR